jgi:hypothetical protein
MSSIPTRASGPGSGSQGSSDPSGQGQRLRGSLGVAGTGNQIHGNCVDGRCGGKVRACVGRRVRDRRGYGRRIERAERHVHWRSEEFLPLIAGYDPVDDHFGTSLEAPEEVRIPGNNMNLTGLCRF